MDTWAAPDPTNCSSVVSDVEAPKLLVALRRFANTPEAGLQAAAIVRLAAHHNGGEPGMVIGASLGGDGRLIPLIHSVRMVLTIIIVPVSFRLSMHLPPTSAMQQVGLFDIAPRDVLILALCAVAGVVIAKRLRLPAPYMLGAMALSALVHVTGITASRPPSLLVSAAQVLVGAHVGARFAGVSVAYVGGFARQAATATMIILEIGRAHV